MLSLLWRYKRCPIKLPFHQLIVWIILAPTMLSHSIRFIRCAVSYQGHLKTVQHLRYSVRNLTPSASVSFSSWFSRMGDSQSQSVQTTGLPESNTVERKDKVRLTDKEWRQKLSSEQFNVCRKKGTEQAWTGDLLGNKKKGIYTCTGCGYDLFSSSSKFDSGSGWPSFFNAIKDKTTDVANVEVHTDSSHGMSRTEIMCGRCDSHLGHVFNDGPPPSGMRFCVNSVSITFKPEDSGTSSSM